MFLKFSCFVTSVLDHLLQLKPVLDCILIPESSVATKPMKVATPCYYTHLYRNDICELIQLSSLAVGVIHRPLMQAFVVVGEV